MSKRKKLWAWLLPGLAIMCSCFGKRQEKMTSPPGYDLNNPVVVNLSKKIDQISGIAYSKGDNSLFAIDDDHGDLYKISLTGSEIMKWKVGKKEDYEDVAVVDGNFYILASKGRIISFHGLPPQAGIESADLELKNSNEFESLYHDPATHKLIMLCKQCNDDDHDIVSAYAFDMNSKSFDPKPLLQLKRNDVEKELGQKVSRLKPSAAAVNPLTGEVYIISSINKLLIVTGKNYKVNAVYSLKRKMFEQPEGICFAPDGTLYISNEASNASKANVLIFKYR